MGRGHPWPRPRKPGRRGKSLASLDPADAQGRTIEKALRSITVDAHFTHDPHGGLHPVKAHVRWVDKEEYSATVKKRIEATHKAILALKDGKGRPPYMTTFHMRLGRIGLTYDRLSHIVQERKSKGQDLDATLRGIAEAIVRGDIKKEPHTRDNKRDATPQIWATAGHHQVVLSPFWDEPGLPKNVSTWVVSGYRMSENREAWTAEAAPVEIEILNPNPETK